jgi:hypothetical protein
MPILETVEQKLSELREINVEEMQQNLARLREEKARLEEEERTLLQKRRELKNDKEQLEIINKKKSEISEIKTNFVTDIRRYTSALEQREHYLPVMSIVVEKIKLGHDLSDMLLAFDQSASTDIGYRSALSDFHDILTNFVQSRGDAGVVLQEIRGLMIQHDKFWSPVLRRIDSSAELLSDVTQFNLRPIVEQNFGRVTDYEFEEKTEEAGKYFGGNAIFTYQPHDTSKPPQEIKFFVKGHQNFEMESNKRTNSTRDPKAPDMKEILVYKILEHIGFGPKMHYFINPTARHGLFIATQDSKFTKSPEVKNKQFSTADKVQELAQEPSLADEVELTALDIITRSLVLKDLHMKNYGRVDVFPIEGSDTQEKHKWKLFDFLVLGSAQLDEYDVHREIGENFVTIRNHPDPRFTTSSGLAGSILRSEHLAAHRPQVANTALDTLEGRIKRGSGAQEMPFEQSVRASYDEVTDFIRREGETLGINVDEALSDLGSYCGAVTQNYNALRERIPLMGQEPSTVFKLKASEEKEAVRK